MGELNESLKDRWNYLNFTIQAKQKELNSIPVNQFTYNPKITELSYDIKKLIEEQEELEAQMEDE